MKTSVSITLNFDAGNSIEDAFEDAVEMSNKIGCVMEFTFNEVQCIAFPGTDPKTGSDAYYKAVRSMFNAKIAMSK